MRGGALPGLAGGRGLRARRGLRKAGGAVGQQRGGTHAAEYGEGCCGGGPDAVGPPPPWPGALRRARRGGDPDRAGGNRTPWGDGLGRVFRGDGLERLHGSQVLGRAGWVRGGMSGCVACSGRPVRARELRGGGEPGDLKRGRSGGRQGRGGGEPGELNRGCRGGREGVRRSAGCRLLPRAGSRHGGVGRRDGGRGRHRRIVGTAFGARDRAVEGAVAGRAVVHGRTRSVGRPGETGVLRRMCRMCRTRCPRRPVCRAGHRGRGAEPGTVRKGPGHGRTSLTHRS